MKNGPFVKQHFPGNFCQLKNNLVLEAFPSYSLFFLYHIFSISSTERAVEEEEHRDLLLYVSFKNAKIKPTNISKSSGTKL